MFVPHFFRRSEIWWRVFFGTSSGRSPVRRAARSHAEEASGREDSVRGTSRRRAQMDSTESGGRTCSVPAWKSERERRRPRAFQKEVWSGERAMAAAILSAMGRRMEEGSDSSAPASKAISALGWEDCGQSLDAAAQMLSAVRELKPAAMRRAAIQRWIFTARAGWAGAAARIAPRRRTRSGSPVSPQPGRRRNPATCSQASSVSAEEERQSAVSIQRSKSERAMPPDQEDFWFFRVVSAAEKRRFAVNFCRWRAGGSNFSIAANALETASSS